MSWHSTALLRPSLPGRDPRHALLFSCRFPAEPTGHPSPSPHSQSTNPPPPGNRPSYPPSSSSATPSSLSQSPTSPPHPLARASQTRPHPPSTDTSPCPRHHQTSAPASVSPYATNTDQKSASDSSPCIDSCTPRCLPS